MSPEELGKLVKDYHDKQEERDNHLAFLRESGDILSQLGLALNLRGANLATAHGTSIILRPRPGQGTRNTEEVHVSIDYFQRIIDALEQVNRLRRELARHDETLREAGYENMEINRRAPNQGRA